METINVNYDHILEGLLNPRTKQQAFSQLLTNYQQPIYFFIRRNVAEHEETDELIQDIFLKFFRQITALKPGDDLHELIYTFVARACQRYFKKQAQSLWLPTLVLSLKQEEFSLREIAGMLALSPEEVRTAYHSPLDRNNH